MHPSEGKEAYTKEYGSGAGMLPLLKQTRVVVVTSASHSWGPPYLDELGEEE